MNKRGLSDIVATVLLVLLALAAIAIVWVFIQSTLNQTNTSIELNQKCLEVEVKPLRCQYLSSSPNLPVVRIQVTKGEPSQVVTILENTVGETFVRSETAPATLGTKDIIYPDANYGTPSKARVAARVSNAQSNTLTCKESTIEIDCVAV